MEPMYCIRSKNVNNLLPEIMGCREMKEWIPCRSRNDTVLVETHNHDCFFQRSPTHIVMLM